MARGRIMPERVIRAIKKHRGRIFHAAKELGVSIGTIYGFIKEFPSIAEARNFERGLVLDDAEKKLQELIAKGDAQSVKFFLQSKAKHRGYAEKLEKPAKSSLPGGAIVSIGGKETDLMSLPPERLRAVLQLIFGEEFTDGDSSARTDGE